MFRERPLTWLFVIATITVDLALTALKDSDLAEYLFVPLLFGQLSALSIWAVRGQTHRLLRATILVIATGLLVRAVAPDRGALAFVFVYVLALVMFTFLSDVARKLIRSQENSAAATERWQFPLVELFGWTILVAVVSFGWRYMDFEGLFDRADWISWSMLFGMPMLFAFFVRNDLRNLGWAKALIMIGAVFASVLWSVDESYILMLAMSAYLVAWMTVITLDNMFVETASVINSLADPATVVREPQLFNPQE